LILKPHCRTSVMSPGGFTTDIGRNNQH